MMTQFWTFAAFAFAFGAVVGSFLNVVIHRVPVGDSIVSPPSRCPACEHEIRWYDNIPIVSWFVLGGQCRYCGHSISIRYTAVEALTGGLALLLWYRVAHPVFARTSPLEPFPVAAVAVPFVLYFAFIALLVAITFVDLEHYIIPHVLTVPGMVLGLATPWAFRLTFGDQYLGVVAELWPPVTPWESILGWLVGGLLVITIFYLYLAARGVAGLGGGDVTLMAMIGAWLGWPALIFVLFASSLQGTIAAGLAELAGRQWAQPLADLLQHDPADEAEREPSSEPSSASTSSNSPSSEGGDPSSDGEQDDSASPSGVWRRVSLEPPSHASDVLPDTMSDVTDIAEDDSSNAPTHGPRREPLSSVEPPAPRPTDKLAIPYGPFLALAALEHFFLGPYLPSVLSMSYLYDLWHLP